MQQAVAQIPWGHVDRYVTRLPQLFSKCFYCQVLACGIDPPIQRISLEMRADKSRPYIPSNFFVSKRAHKFRPYVSSIGTGPPQAQRLTNNVVTMRAD